MANIKFTNLPAVGTPSRLDIYACVNGGDSKQLTAAETFETMIASDVTAALTYTPANKAGDTFSGNVNVGASFAFDISSATATIGQTSVVGGRLALKGLTSGVATIVAASAAGTPILTLPTTSGTLATTANIGIVSLNALNTSTQLLAIGTTGTDVAWSSVTATHTLNIPSASATARGLVTTGVQSFAGAKTFTGDIYNTSGTIKTSTNAADSLVIIENTAGGGKQWRLNSADNGLFKITNGSTASDKLSIDASGSAIFYTGSITSGTTGTTTGAFKLAGSTSGLVTITPANAAGTWTWTIPDAAPAVNGYALTGLTTGVSSWTNITSAVLTGYVSGAGTISASDTILSAINKLNGNIAAGTSQWTTDANGITYPSNVGIGGASSASYKLSVTGNILNTGIFTTTADAVIHTLNFGMGGGSSNTNLSAGYRALESNSSGIGNTAVGSQALQTNSTSTGSTAVGYQVLLNATGASNTFGGTSAGAAINTGATNTGWGRDAAARLTSGSGGVYLGYSAGAYATTQSNELFIDNQDRGSRAGDIAGALLYGVFNATPSSQTLTINGAITTPYAAHIVGAVTLGTAGSATGSVIFSGATSGTATMTVSTTASQFLFNTGINLNSGEWQFTSTKNVSHHADPGSNIGISYDMQNTRNNAAANAGFFASNANSSQVAQLLAYGQGASTNANVGTTSATAFDIIANSIAGITIDTSGNAIMNKAFAAAAADSFSSTNTMTNGKRVCYVTTGSFTITMNPAPLQGEERWVILRSGAIGTNLAANSGQSINGGTGITRWAFCKYEGTLWEVFGV